MSQRALTGIKPTGQPHLGNLIGAIRPALRLAEEGFDAMYFIADYHALTTLQEPRLLRQLTREVAATWLALGLDPEKVLFYRQSDVVEIFELAWVLACFTAKGWMNKAHAYKALAAANRNASDADAGINMGIYGYPILMAADILVFDVDVVPVGADQVQHVEIARDIAQRLNLACGADVLKLPQAKTDHDGAVILGLDGRKMSKSYDNTIPLFAPSQQLRKYVSRIVTDSTPADVPKDPSSSTIFQVYRAVASPEDTRALVERFRVGIGWGDAKQTLYEQLEAELRGPRGRYEELIADPTRIDALLEVGGARARVRARKVLDRVRRAIGIA
jgi:tryptophanyl-tRNA synthetase